MERTAEYSWRRDGISGASLRLPLVYDAEGNRHATPDDLRGLVRDARKGLREFFSLPAPEQEARARSMTESWRAIRAARNFEKPFDKQGFWEHPDTLFVNDRENVSEVDSRALGEPFQGTDSLFIIDAARKLIGFEPEHSYRQFLDEGTA